MADTGNVKLSPSHTSCTCLLAATQLSEEGLDVRRVTNSRRKKVPGERRSIATFVWEIIAISATF